VAKALSVIHTHLSRRLPINVRQIAEKLNMSESNLRLLFHKTTGSSISDYIAEQRLETAQYHLLHSTLGIGEIAEICGYESVYAFSAFFKKKTGVSPRTFRNRSISDKG
jgi:AraC-like DNA-binding protein